MKSSLALCMIVKNEENWIKHPIDSVRSIVDEIIVVDTGSRDSTVKEAQSAGAEVYHFDWCDDFSAARNFSIEKANSDFILVLDADETLDQETGQKIIEIIKKNNDALIGLIQTTYSFHAEYYGWIHNQLDLEEAKPFPGYQESLLLRLFPNKDKYRFVGRVHEHLIDLNDPETTFKNSNLRIHHYGLVRKDIKTDKQNLYHHLGYLKMQDYPDNIHYVYEYAISAWEMGKMQEACQYLESIIRINPKYLKALVALGQIYFVEKKIDMALSFFKEALKVNSNSAHIYIGLAQCLEAKNEIHSAVTLLDAAYEVLEPNMSLVKLYLGLLKKNNNEDRFAAVYQQSREDFPNDFSFLGGSQ